MPAASFASSMVSLAWVAGFVVLGALACQQAPVKSDSSARDGRLDAIEKRLGAIEQQLAAASASASSSASANAWACAAKCVTKFSCSTNGDNNVSWKTISSVGSTAVEAFDKLEAQCDDVLYVQGQCANGAFARTEATLANACIRN